MSGTVHIGPLCPVERNPPDPNCQPKAETYKAWPIWIWNSDKSVRLVQIQPGLNGSYTSDLPSGKYVIDLDIPNRGIGGRNLPAPITILANQTTQFDVNIDTGIR